MAFCVGYYNFSGVSCSCLLLSTHNKFAKKVSNMSQLFHVTYTVTSVYKRPQWSNINAKNNIASSSPGTSRLYQPHRTNISIKHHQEIEEIRRLLQSKGEFVDKPIERLMLVDAIQSLGVDHHYEEEIETILGKLYRASSNANIHGFHTLHDVSLCFRLLRQRGHYVSSDVFTKFKGKDGRFRGELKHDVEGLMELHEASHLRFEGEHTLDRAEIFSSHNLNESLVNMDNNWCNIVSNKLQHPYHKSIARLTTRNRFLRDFGGMNQLLELAAMDLHMRKCKYKEEMSQVSEWWNKLRLAVNLSLARNQPLKWYTGAMVILIDDISLSEQRINLAKSITFIYLIDDIFDVYGTHDELVIFAQAVNKWDYSATDTLPDYMKMCYKGLLDTTNEICCKIYEKYGYNPIDSLKTTECITPEKMHLMKKAMRLVVSSLSAADRLSIVAYSSTSKRLLPLRRMTTADKRAARRIIDAAVPLDGGSATTAADSIKKAAKVLEDRREINPVSTILLFFDGHRNGPVISSTWANLCNAFLVEAEWFESGKPPSTAEYLENGKISTGVHVVMDNLFFLLGLGGASLHIKDTSQLTSSVATILRLWDDLGTAKDEYQDGKDGSYTSYLIQEHVNLSQAQAYQHTVELIAKEWRRLNEECFVNLNHVSASSFKKAALNAARMVPLMYSYDDNHRLPILEEYVKFMLLD